MNLKNKDFNESFQFDYVLLKAHIVSRPAYKLRARILPLISRNAMVSLRQQMIYSSLLVLLKLLK